MQLTLGLTGLLPYFTSHQTDRIFSAYEISRWKPDPTLYLHAAEVMEVTPHFCAVVEDSPVGAQAGVTAGMQVFGYADLTDEADLIAVGAQPFRSMRDLHLLLTESPGAPDKLTY